MAKRQPTKEQARLWNRLVEEVFEHPKSEYSLFVYEMIKRRVLGTSREQYRATSTSDKKNGIKCLLLDAYKSRETKE